MNRTKVPYSFSHRFRCAWHGLVWTLREERHFKFHVVALLLVVIAGFYFQINFWEWMIVCIVSSLVISLELVNAALERALDHLHPDQHPAIGLAKDILAGAVLVAALSALIVGMLVFIPKLIG